MISKIYKKHNISYPTLRDHPVSQGLKALLVPLLSFYAFYLVVLSQADFQYIYSFGDPDFGYLMNSLMILEGNTPWHIDHPGTPVQLMGALVMWLRFLFFGTEANVTADFFRNPIPYHLDMILLTFGVFLLCQWYCGWRLLRSGLGWMSVLAVQATPFLFHDFFFYLEKCSPETWIAAFCLLLVPALWQGQVIAAGMLIGLLVSLKVYAFPLAILLLCLPRPRQWLIATGAAAFIFLNITAVSWPAYSRIYDWIARLLTHQGMYGIGPKGIPPLNEWLANANLIFSAELRWVFAALLFSLTLSFTLPLRKTWREQARGVISITPEVLSIIFVFALASKHFAVERYLFPAMAPVGLLLVKNSLSPIWVRPLPWIATLVMLTTSIPSYLPLLALGSSNFSLEIRALGNILKEEYPDCAYVFMDASAEKPFALFAGHMATDNYFSKRLHALYPQYFFPAGDHFRTFSGLYIDWNELRTELKPYPCRIFIFNRGKNGEFGDEVPPAPLRPSPRIPHLVKDIAPALLYVEGSVAPRNRAGHGIVRER